MNGIANTRTEKGLTVKAELDTGSYPTGIHSDGETMARLVLVPESFHGEWNYTIKPQSLNDEVISSCGLSGCTS